MQRHELDRFQKTLEVVGVEHDAAENDRRRLVPIVDELFKQINRSEDYNAYVEYQLHELLLSRASMMARSLHLARLQPYFTRIDFEPKEEDAGEIGGTYYIGKYGVVDSRSMESVVVDWRAPIANLYYSGQIGPTHYVTPDGKIEGNLTLKRQFNIEDGVLKSYYDADMVSQDKLLGEVLGSVSQGKLKEVVTTIQAEQNAVIRHPMNKSLIVQGVAGSGKTTIALHRIAYLLYTYQKTLLPRCLMILAPNPLFLDYISSVLPDLGVQDVHQLTFRTLCEELMDEDDLPKMAPDDRLVRALSSPDEAKKIAETCAEKGSVEYLSKIDAFLDEIEEEICPGEDIFFGPVLVYGREQLRQMMLVDMKPQPVNARIQAIIRHGKGRIKEAAKKVEELLIEDSARRADHIRARLEDGPERRQRLQRLYSSRDQRIAEAKKEAPKFAREFARRWKPLSAKALYARFLGVERLKSITEDDLPALIWIQRRINGLKKSMRLMHIIIDEAQDYSAAQLHMLSAVFNRPGYTLVGDMGQNIHFYRNISGWEVAHSVVPDAQIKKLVTSYRTTVEIMQEANKVAARHPYPGQTEAKPVLRSGEPPLYLHAKSEKERVGLISAQIKRMQGELHYNSVCIIESSPKRAKALAAALEGVSLLDHLSSSYSSGAYVASIDQIKGLEFDAVIIANAGEGQYPDMPHHARLLYVAMTRPLHRLSVIHTGRLSPLFGK
jgi:DNA helicase-2/ATP-dependent DNA helicase PcrA